MMKLVVLTGSSRGLGYAIYNQLVGNENIRLICISRNIVEEQSFLLKSDQNKFDFIEMDFSTACESEFESIAEDKIRGTLRDDIYTEIIFISNAGVIVPIGMVGHLDSNDIKQATNVNFLAPMLIAQVLVRLAESLSVKLKIINISSGAAKHSISGWSVYCATKSAILMFFDVMSEMPNCEINHVDPGVLDTDMQLQLRHASQDEFPDVDIFRNLNENGELVDPAIVAKNIVETIH